MTEERHGAGSVSASGDRIKRRSHKLATRTRSVVSTSILPQIPGSVVSLGWPQLRELLGKLRSAVACFGGPVPMVLWTGGC